jgi:hypothetical protein
VPIHSRFQEASTLNFTPRRHILRTEGEEYEEKIFLILFLVFALMRPVVPCGWAQPKSGTHAPVITHSFAVDKGQYGFIWKI